MDPKISVMIKFHCIINFDLHDSLNSSHRSSFRLFSGELHALLIFSGTTRVCKEHREARYAHYQYSNFKKSSFWFWDYCSNISWHCLDISKSNYHHFCLPLPYGNPVPWTPLVEGDVHIYVPQICKFWRNSDQPKWLIWKNMYFTIVSSMVSPGTPNKWVLPVDILTPRWWWWWWSLFSWKQPFLTVRHLPHIKSLHISLKILHSHFRPSNSMSSLTQSP